MLTRLRYVVLTVIMLIVGFDTSRAQSTAMKSPGCSVSLRPGRWRTSGGNSFWIQCAGAQVFWLGMNSARDTVHRGAMWTQVGHGTIQGTLIDLIWSDVPYGAIRTGGRIQLRVDADTVLRVTRDDGPFGISELRWVGGK